MPKSDNNLINLRALEPDDVDFLYECENNQELWTVSNTLTPISKYQLNKYIEASDLDIYTTKQLRIVISERDNPVGLIDLYDFEPYHLRAGIGILVYNKSDRRKHYASNALRQFIDYSFNVLKLKQLYCEINTKNTGSIKLFENAGFQISGTRKEWLKSADGYDDIYFLQLINKSKK